MTIGSICYSTSTFYTDIINDFKNILNFLELIHPENQKLKWIGLSKPSVTLDIYGHMIPGQQDKAAAVMDEITTPPFKVVF